MNLRRLGVSVVVMLSIFAVASCSKKPEQRQPIAGKARPLEGFSVPAIQAFNDRRQKFSAPPRGMSLGRVQAVIQISRVWSPGQEIKVAFKAGSSQLRNQIATAVKPWTDAANIAFDFGSNPTAGQFREWNDADTSYQADIRISFSQVGYWSQVGKDSIDPSIAKPNEASMNFEGFADALPQDWQGVVLHEFGHAIGFEHEHQNPISDCEQEFRWDDDPSYVGTQDSYGQFIPDPESRRPGIYTVLEGPLNRWSKDQIDFNLRRLPDSSDWLLTGFDKNSIMKYYFPDWMFKQGQSSSCYSAENVVLSDTDRAAALKAYPKAPSLLRSAIQERLKALNDVLAFKDLTAGEQKEYKARIKALRKDLK